MEVFNTEYLELLLLIHVKCAYTYIEKVHTIFLEVYIEVVGCCS